MVVVADSSALIALATCQALPVLPVLFESVHVPRSVYDEVTVSTKPLATQLALFLRDRVLPVDIRQYVVSAGGLGRGEIEAMALYRALAADYLLIDDRHARAVAEANQIRCIGTLGVLLLAKDKEIIPQISPLVELLRESSLHFSSSLLERVLVLSGESED